MAISQAGKSERGSWKVDIKSRMDEVVGQEPRILPLQVGELDTDQLAVITSIRAAIGSATGEVIPEFFRTVVKHPALFRCQLETGIMHFRGLIPPRERELVVLRVAWLCQAPYEWGEHVEIAKRYGLHPDEIERITRGHADAEWSENDASILLGVEELMTNYALSDQTWSKLSAIWSEAQLLEFPMLVGAYVATAFQQNSIRMRLDSNNSGLSHR
jgi:4-carboxymuconolactone decarboxylase